MIGSADSRDAAATTIVKSTGREGYEAELTNAPNYAGSHCLQLRATLTLQVETLKQMWHEHPKTAAWKHEA